MGVSPNIVMQIQSILHAKNNTLMHLKKKNNDK